MSDNRHLLTDLLKDDCLASGRCYETLFSGARKGGNRGGAGETSPDNAAEVSRDREAGRIFSATGVINSTSSLIGGLGWGAKIMTLRPIDVCNATRNNGGSPHDRVHAGAESCGLTPSRAACAWPRIGAAMRDSRPGRRTPGADALLRRSSEGRHQPPLPVFFNPEQPA